MQCAVCSKQLHSHIIYCPACRAATPALSPDFAEMERRLSQLKTRRRAGILNDADYNAGVQGLVVYDAAGNTWWLGGGHGGWFWHNGPSWEPRDPASVILAGGQEPRKTPPVAVFGGQATPSAAVPTHRTRWSHLLIVCLAFAILMAIVFVVAGSIQ